MGTDATTTSTTLSNSYPAELCGYAVVETLVPDSCHLAIGPGGRRITLKKLDPDCLHGSLLHPDVHERLSRVRELAHTGVANLFGVGKEGESSAWLIWEFIEGKPLAQHVREKVKSPRELAVLVRELALTLESLHMQGIVHGAIQSNNIIVAPSGSIHFTHISPLLYNDPADDVEAMEYAIEMILDERNERDTALGKVIAEAREASMPLRGLAARLAMLTEAPEVEIPPAETLARTDRRVRKRALVGAMVVTLVGFGVAYGVWHAAGQPVPDRISSWLIGRSAR